MIDLEVIIDRLRETTDYTISQARAKEPELTGNLPIIYVGYHTIDSKNTTSAIDLDIYNLHGENLVQSFDIQIGCKQVDLSAIWMDVYKQLIGWNPKPSEAIYSSFTYERGGIMGLSNDSCFWLDRWIIGFPSLDINF
jgi:hypothetical protein